MTNREELEAVIAGAIEDLPMRDCADQGGELDRLRVREAIRAIATALLSSGYTKGNGEPVAHLRDAQPDAEDEALFVCAKGDSGCFPVYAEPVPDKGNGELVAVPRSTLESLIEEVAPFTDEDREPGLRWYHIDRWCATLRKALSDSEGVGQTNGDHHDEG